MDRVISDLGRRRCPLFQRAFGVASDTDIEVSEAGATPTTAQTKSCACHGFVIATLANGCRRVHTGADDVGPESAAEQH